MFPQTSSPFSVPFNIMTISSIHHRKVDGLIASAAPVCSNCLRAEDCNLSVDAGSTAHAVTPSTWHAMPCHAMVCSRSRSRSPLLTLIDPACSHHTSLVATSRTSRRKHYSTWRHRALFLGQKDWAIVRAESVHVLHSAPTVLVIIIPIGTRKPIWTMSCAEALSPGHVDDH